jgi:hypothetical protein
VDTVVLQIQQTTFWPAGARADSATCTEDHAPQQRVHLKPIPDPTRGLFVTTLASVGRSGILALN